MVLKLFDVTFATVSDVDIDASDVIWCEDTEVSYGQSFETRPFLRNLCSIRSLL